MDRRDFLKLASCAGLSVITPSAFGGRDLSAGRKGIADAYTGHLFLLFNAGGGWDPTSFCDPKGAKSENDPNPMNHYLAEDIQQAGNIRFPGNFPDDANSTGVIPYFFETYYDRLTVINGIDMETNGHDAGSRHQWSGRLSEGHPSLGAYLAATFDSALPMSFLTYGGFDLTEGIVAKTRAANINVLQNLAYPTRINPNDETSTFHSERALELIEEAQWHRDKALHDGQGLPKIRAAINTLWTARSGSNELKRLQEYLPEQLPQENLARQAAIAIAAYRAGICIAANLNIGGFDTHGNHDGSHIPRLEQLLSGIDFAMQEAERQGVADKVVIVAGSDFGRTPGYNDGNGKDHWSVSSMLLMGAGIPGNHVIGETNETHQAYGIDPSTLAVDKSPEPAVKIKPGHIHQALRDKYALGNDNPLAAMFPLTMNERLQGLLG